jgi:hypothetical protein
MWSVNTAGILLQGTFPGHRKRQEERVEPWGVEAFTQVAPRRKDDATRVSGFFIEGSERGVLV